MTKAEPLTESAIAEMTRLCESATPAPWHIYHHGVFSGHHRFQAYGGNVCVMCNETNPEQDADFIAAARSFVPSALAELARAAKVIEAARQVLDWYAMMIDDDVLGPCVYEMDSLCAALAAYDTDRRSEGEGD